MFIIYRPGESLLIYICKEETIKENISDWANEIQKYLNCLKYYKRNMILIKGKISSLDTKCKLLYYKWQPTPVSLPGKSHGWKSLVGYSP